MEALTHVVRMAGIFLLINVQARIGQAADIEDLRQSVFKVRTVSQEPDYGSPWRLRSQHSGNGTGFYIGDNRILTNAHVVANGRYVTVERDGDARPVVAQVKFIAHDCDLAVLALKDPAVLRGVSALKLGQLPALHSPVTTIGYPMGGEQISITQGIVSRIGFSFYSHAGDREHLLVQVDSAINPGNSGGPVVQDGKVVGVAFQAFTSAENTGYIIPTPVIRRFLTDIEDGRYDGHPEDGIVVQSDALENSATSAFHGQERGEGVKVIAVLEHVPAFGLMRPGDVLLAINGEKIGLDGRLVYQGERVDFEILYDLSQIGDVVRFTVLRDGKRIEVKVPVAKSKPHFERSNTYPLRPKYAVYGGMVFTNLSRNYLQIWGRNWYQKAPLLLRYLQRNAYFMERFKKCEDIVVVASRLAHPLNAYARDREATVVDTVDGKSICSFDDLLKVLRGAKDEFVQVRLLERDDPIVLPRQRAAEVGEEIRKRYKIDLPEWLKGPEVDGTTREGA